MGFGKARPGAALRAGAQPGYVLPPAALREMLAYMDGDETIGAAAPSWCCRMQPGPGLPPQLSNARSELLSHGGLSKLFPHSRRFGRYNMTFLDPDIET